VVAEIRALEEADGPEHLVAPPLAAPVPVPTVNEVVADVLVA
jgi:hypothetical protein